MWCLVQLLALKPVQDSPPIPQRFFDLFDATAPRLFHGDVRDLACFAVHAAVARLQLNQTKLQLPEEVSAWRRRLAVSKKGLCACACVCARACARVASD